MIFWLSTAFPSFVRRSKDIRWRGECWVHCYTQVIDLFAFRHLFTIRFIGMQHREVITSNVIGSIGLSSWIGAVLEIFKITFIIKWNLRYFGKTRLTWNRTTRSFWRFTKWSGTLFRRFRVNGTFRFEHISITVWLSGVNNHFCIYLCVYFEVAFDTALTNSRSDQFKWMNDENGHSCLFVFFY